MARMVIKNLAEEHWQQAIESKLQVMLGSMMGDIGRIDVTLDKSLDQRTGQSTYACTLIVRENGGQSHKLHSHQPYANLAIEGAIARARRALIRLKRSRVSVWGQSSSQKQMTPGVLYNLHN